MSNCAYALAAVTSDQWLDYLRRQRWFGGKAREATDASLSLVLELAYGLGASYAVARVNVRLADNSEDQYQILAYLPDRPLYNLDAKGVIARVSPPEQRVYTIPQVWPGTPRNIVTQGGGQRELMIFDAVPDRGFQEGMARLLAGEGDKADRSGVLFTTGESDGVRWEMRAVPGVEMPRFDATRVRVGGAEQSNTSLIIDDTVILKLFRKLEPGVHPDVEVTRFLTTEAHFPHTPSLLATVAFAGGAQETVAGMAQRYLPGSTDAWSYILDLGRAFFHTGAREAVASAAKQLGAVTRELHEALGSGTREDFSAEDVDDDDLARWAQGARAAINNSLGLLEHQLSAGGGALLKSLRLSQAQALLGRRQRYLDWVTEAEDALGEDLGARIRVHGDYHLGQVLRTADGEFMVIDFEGEPARPLAERREKSSPMRDVAGMMRSFAYAAATLLASEGDASDNGARTAGERETNAARLERDLREGFLAGYRAAGDPDAPELLPESWENALRLMSLFEADKAFYELAYELNNRPDWVWIPMRGIAKLLV